MITEQAQKALAALARAANRRIERATEGQRKALEHYTRQYHTRERANGMIVFQQGKAKTEAEYKARMRELELFMGSAKQPTISKRSEWERVKRENVKAAGETLRGDGSSITDEELATLLEELDGGGTAEFYKALANVEIAKERAGENWSASPEAIRDAISARRSAQERVELLIKARAGKTGR